MTTHKTVTLIKKLLLLCVLSFSSFNALADFDLAGKGALKYPTGMTKPFEFGFAFKQGDNGYFFKVGQQKMNTSDLPSKYTIWVTLHKNEHVFVQEFGKGYFQELDWKLGSHEIKLHKKVFKDRRVKGDYVLSIDGDEFFFGKTTGQINIHFNKKGIRNIDTVGFVRDRSFSKY